MRYKSKIIEEAKKAASFKFYHGWEGKSGYIHGIINCNNRFDSSFKFSISVSKNAEFKTLDKDQIENKVEKYFNSLFKNNEHPSVQIDFCRYVINNYYMNISDLKREILGGIFDNLNLILLALETSDDFDLPGIQNLHNNLKNYEAELLEQESVYSVLTQSRNYKPAPIEQKTTTDEFGDIKLKPRKKKREKIIRD